ncbi:MAG: hypothetical protein ACJ8AT_16585 [Hyalangium sp.]|uniref:hypothetical protein n=1 Tax=Hyalangium sp. TaxID=2028555 RepID=UPI00389A3FF8
MTASMTSAAVRFSDAFVALAAASAVVALLLPVPSLAATPNAQTMAVTPLEERLLTPSGQPPDEMHQPVLGYLRPTKDGWKLDMLPGAVARTGPLPGITTYADTTPEYPPSQNVPTPYAPLFRVDF